MHVYLLHHREHTFYRFRASNINSVIYSELRKYADDHVYSNTSVHLEHFKNQERGLSSVATVVDLSKGNTYHVVSLSTVVLNSRDW